MLRDYSGNWASLLRVVYEPMARDVFTHVYDSLATGQKVRNGKVALVLCICATSAFFWDASLRGFCRFKSDEDAQEASKVWRKQAWDLLDQSPRSAAVSLEDVQARMLLADLVYNTEALSFRFRFLQNCAAGAARELSFHLVDSPSRSRADDAITREIQRRIWWHLASTDW